MISVLILTKNEQQDLPGCLESVSWSDDIHVYDSFSTDETLAIASTAGAVISQRNFDNWAAHHNWALDNIVFKHPWVFYVDADERVSPELKESLFRAVENPGDKVAFRLQRRDFWRDTWLKHVQTSPFYIRLYRPSEVRYDRIVHVQTIPKGPVGELSGYLNHYPFSKGISHWVHRHDAYSTLEAQLLAAGLNAPLSLRGAFLERDFHKRRAHQKALFYRLPFRPLVKFIALYFLKRGFLDGRAGLDYSLLQSFYEYLIVLKTQEKRHGAKQNK